MPSYDFAPLSPPDFETLAADLLEASEGLVLERFGPGRDKGIDLRCAVNGNTIVQCKHYFRSGDRALISSLKKEVEKWRYSHGVDRYILVTSVRMTVGLKSEIHQILSAVLPVTTSDIYGLEDLNSLIARHPRIERQNFKLWINSTTVLEKFIRSESWSRTEDLLESIAARAKFFVQTDKYPESLDVLDEKKVCIIVGPPGVGKSLLAEMLLLAHSREGFQVVPISADVSEGYAAWNPAERQIFYYDDFLGQTNIAESLGRNQDDRLGTFIAKVERSDGKRFVLTTRDQILRNAEVLSDRIRRAAALSGRTIVSIDDYSTYAKAKILYNHVYFSRLDAEERYKFIRDERYLDYIQHPNYSPRIVEQVIRRSSTAVASLYVDLDASLANPEDLWIASYSDLSLVARALLRHLLSYPPMGAKESAIRQQMNSVDVSTYAQSLKVLDGTWIKVSRDIQNDSSIAFANPSCRDFLLHQIKSEDPLADEAIENADSVERLTLLYGYAFPSSYVTERDSSDALRRAFVRRGSGIVTTLQLLYSKECAELAASVRNQGRLPWHMTVDPRPYLLRLIRPLVTEIGVGSDQQWVSTEIDKFINGPSLGQYIYKNAAHVLQLAELLVHGSADDIETSRWLVEYSLSLINSWEELDELRTLSPSLNIDLYEEVYSEMATRILDDQIAYYRSDCSDSDEISQAATDICQLAQDFGLDYSDSVTPLYERIEELPENEDVYSGPRYRAPTQPATSGSVGQAVRELFQGLAD